MIRIAVCDDCRIDRSKILNTLTAYFNKRNEKIAIVEYEDGISLLEDYEDRDVGCFDLVFLDIIMGRSHGVDVARKLREFDPRACLIFITTTPEFALEGYSVHAFQYLIKPVDKQTLIKLLDGFVKLFHRDRKTSILIKNKGTQERIPYKDIVYMESQTPYVYVHLVDGSIHRINAKLVDVLNEIKVKNFIRCHQSFIVNLSKVKKMDKCFIMEGGDKIPVRRNDIKVMREKYYQFVIETTI